MSEQVPLDDERREVIRISRRMVADGLVVGTAGNVSLRRGGLVAVTPSGVEYDELTVTDVPVVDLGGAIVHGALKPTSELPMHLTAYDRHRAGAVVHTHSLYATALSLVRSEVPAVHYQLAEFGGSVRVAEYATFGTSRLAENMSGALADRGACILRNHGTIAVADTLIHAYNRVRQLEWLCQLWLTARQAGEPAVLDEDELSRCAERYATYGQALTDS